MPQSATGTFNTNRASFINSLYTQVKAGGTVNNLDTYEQITNFTNSIYGVGDPLITRLSQIVGRTLMAVRPYSGKLDMIEVTSEEYGWITRKMNFLDDDVQRNLTIYDANDLVQADGNSVDPWVIHKPKVVETQSYGGGQISRLLTIYQDQIKGAFASPAALDEFISGVLLNFNNQIEQDREQYKRTALMNFMGCLSTYSDRVIYLVSEYNAATSSSLTSTTVFAPANFEGFVQWLYGFIQKLMGLMSERSYKFHLNPTTASPISGYISRQTRYPDMRCFLNTGFKEDMTARVVANTFNKDELKEVKYEGVNFWQNIDDPTSLKVTVKPMTTALAEGSATAVNLKNVFGVLFDRDALTVSYMNDNTGTSPYNQRGRYYNLIHSEDVKISQDLSMNGVLLLLDTAP